jgi:Uma2 family endonuclease
MTLTRERAAEYPYRIFGDLVGDEMFVRATELIDGEEVPMASATIRHNKIALQICLIFLEYIKHNQLQDAVYDNVTLHIAENVEYVPDVMLVNENDDNIDSNAYYGIPELVIEIASPSTERIDLNKKRKAYAKLNIPEYWTVDPYSKKFTVWKNDNGVFEVDEIYQLPPPNAKNVSEYKTKINTLYYGDKLTLDLYDIFKNV